jgi:hypothetical protein
MRTPPSKRVKPAAKLPGSISGTSCRASALPAQALKTRRKPVVFPKRDKDFAPNLEMAVIGSSFSVTLLEWHQGGRFRWLPNPG